MGFIYHDAIVVTSWQKESAEMARIYADAIGLHPSEVCGPVVNGYCSFLIPPDGSKEGWQTSDEFDERRANFLAWLDKQQDAGRYFDYVHVKYGEAPPMILGGGETDPEAMTDNTGV